MDSFALMYWNVESLFLHSANATPSSCASVSRPSSPPQKFENTEAASEKDLAIVWTIDCFLKWLWIHSAFDR